MVPHFYINGHMDGTQPPPGLATDAAVTNVSCDPAVPVDGRRCVYVSGDGLACHLVASTWANQCTDQLFE